MASKPTDPLERDQRLQDVVLAYLKAVDAGQKPDQQELLARHPELTDDLRAFFSGQHKIQVGIAPLRRVLEPQSSPPFSKRGFGDYELLKEIGHGGMGIVYEARQSRPKRFVALKMIRAGQLASPDDVRRFRTEAEIAATLDHPNIVPIFEVGERDGQHYFTMKRIECGSLAKHLPRFIHSPRASARLVAKVARAVYHGHQRGILHRDLKPANILLDARGQPHVTDFGLAKHVEGNSGMTQTGAIVGTASNMSPEQAAGKKHLTTAVDVYGLGTILYELLTGRPPFWATTVMETLRLVLDTEPARPRTLNSKLDRDLETICLKCLEKDPGRRYGSAEALAEDLESWLAGEPIEGRRSSVWERGLKWAKRRPAVATLTGICAAAFLGMIALMIALWANAEKRASAVKQLETAQGQLDEYQDQLKGLEKSIEKKQAEVQQLDQMAREARGASRRAMCIRDVQLAQMGLEKEQVERTLLLLGKHIPQTDQEDVRGFEWHYLWRLCHNERFILRGHKDFVTSALFTSDGKTLISLDDGGTLKLWDPWFGKEIAPPASLSGHVHSVAISPDGKTLAAGCEDGTVKLLDWPTGKEKTAIKTHGSPIISLAFSPNGKVLATAGKDDVGKLWDMASGTILSTLIVKDARSGKEGPISKFLSFSPDGNTLVTWSGGPTIQLWTNHKGSSLNGQAGAWITGVASSPDGKSMAMAEAYPNAPQEVGRVRLRDAGTGKDLANIDVPGGGAWSVLFSPDGKTLASGHSNLGVIKLWNMPSREPRNSFYGNFSRVYTMAFSPDGQLLATGNYDKTIRIWNATDQQLPVTLRGHTGAVTSVAFTPDGRTLASGDSGGVLRFWDPRNGEVIRPFPKDQGDVSVAFSPDGKMAVSAAKDGAAKLWEVITGKELANLRGLQGQYCSVAFAPDGHTVALGRFDGVVELWDPESKKQKDSLLCGQPKRAGIALAFSPDGKMLACCSSFWENHSIKVWDLASKQETRAFKASSNPESLAFSPDSRMLAAGCWDGTINLWDVANGKETFLQGHTGHVFPVAFSPDGKTLASGADDANIKLWDLVMMQERFTLKGHSARVTCLAFSSDSKVLASGSSDGTVKLWDARLASGEPPSAQVRAEWVREMERRARSLKIFRMEGGKSAPVDLLDQPLLHYDNSPGDVPEATLWAFGRTGRPEALVAMEFAPEFQGRARGYYEFVSLSSGLLSVKSADADWRWSPKRPGMQLRQFPGSPVPSTSEPERLEQMKNLARQLTAWERTEFKDRMSLPLVEQPIYRYADRSAGLQDGAIFVFSYGRNPEVVLVIESSGSNWQYGLARLAGNETWVNLNGLEVWKGLSGSDPNDVYWAFTEPYLSKAKGTIAGSK
jgi:WD40 repeat protein